MTALDLVLIADRLHSMTTAEHSTAIGILGNKIAALGSPEAAKEWSAKTTLRFPEGATIVPGLVDAHSHPIMGLRITDGIDLSTAKSMDQVRALLGAEAQRGGTRGWLLGWGLDPNVFGSSGPPSVRAFDDLANGLPMFLRFFDGHAALANAYALRLAFLKDKDTNTPPESNLAGPSADQAGLLNEFEAMNFVERAIPIEENDSRRHRLLQLLSSMASSGLTGLHAMDALDGPEALLADIEERSELPLKMRVSPWCGPDDDIAYVVGRLGARGRRWHFAGVKLFLDGTIDNGTAWLNHPDVRGESRASSWPDPEAYAQRILQLDEAGIPTATHAIGDAAIGHVIDVLHRRPPKAHHRIEHLEAMPDFLIPRLASPRISASMQPTHCTHYTAADHSDNWSARMGQPRADWGWRTRDVLDSGAVLALGSDWPIAPYNPLAVMADAQLRRRAGEHSATPVRVGQAMTAYESLEGYTTKPPASIGDRGGMIRIGDPADLTILAADPLAINPDELAELNVHMTIVDGEVVHRSV